MRLRQVFSIPEDLQPISYMTDTNFNLYIKDEKIVFFVRER